MDKLVTVATFRNQPDLLFIRGRLESEGIECFTKDELMAQLYMSAIVGGIKLQVKQSDVKRAVLILLETGYLNVADLQPSNFWITFDNLTNKIFPLNKIRVELRLIILATLILTILSIFAYRASIPSAQDYELPTVAE